MTSITGQCGEGKKIASACGCARISARPMSSAAVTGMRPKCASVRLLIVGMVRKYRARLDDGRGDAA